MDLLAPPPPLLARPPITQGRSMGFAFALSAFVHLAIAWRLTFGLPSIPMRAEGGHEGAGGATFEVSVAGPEADAPSPIALPTPTEPSTLATTPTARPQRSTVRSEPTSITPEEESVGAHDADSADIDAPAIATTGTGAETTDSGRLRGRDDARLRALLEGSTGGLLGGSSLGDVALLERASRCPDPIAGTWTAHRYSPEFRDWARFTLSITRDGDELTGTIRTRMWHGLPSDTRPPPCTPGGWDYTVEMTAHGQVRGEHFDFGAREHHIAQIECSSPSFGYNPDHFTGEADIALDQLHTTNNDGGRDVNAAYTFRRSSCQP